MPSRLLLIMFLLFQITTYTWGQHECQMHLVEESFQNPIDQEKHVLSCSMLGGISSVRDLSPSQRAIIDVTKLPYQPIKEVNLVFHVFQKEGGNPGNFSNSSQDLNYLLDLVHHPSFGINALHSDMCNDDTDIQDSRIRFKLSQEDIFFWKNNESWSNGHWWCSNADGGAWNVQRSRNDFNEYVEGPTGDVNLSLAQKDAIHIMFYEASKRVTDSIDVIGGGFANGIGSRDHQNYIVLTAKYSEYVDSSMQMTAKQGWILAHEIGHLMGVYHPWQDPDVGVLSPDSSSIMSYSNERCRFTKEHIQTFHFHLNGNKKTPTNYTTLIDAVCTESCEDKYPPIVIPMGESVVWGEDVQLNSGVVIENGGSLLIDNCTVGMPKYAIIQVKEGGLLEVKDATITNNCGEYWEHIEVNGDPQSSQIPTKQGKLILRNSVIEYAKTGVLLDEEGDNGFNGGGILDAQGTTFLNCKRGVSFITYAGDNTTKIDNCDFIVNDDYIGNSYQKGLISMWQVDGVEIENSNFKNETSGPINRFSGIYALNSGFSVTDNCSFDNFNHAVFVRRYGGGSNQVEIYDNDFTNNNYAIRLIDNQNVDVKCNRIEISNTYGLHINTIDNLVRLVWLFTNNWWGDSSGPYHSVSNTSGTGAEISNNIPSFDFNPWLTTSDAKCSPGGKEGEGGKKKEGELYGDNDDVDVIFFQGSSLIFIESSVSEVLKASLLSLEGRHVPVNLQFSENRRSLELTFLQGIRSGIYVVNIATSNGFEVKKIFIH